MSYVKSVMSFGIIQFYRSTYSHRIYFRILNGHQLRCLSKPWITRRLND